MVYDGLLVISDCFQPVPDENFLFGFVVAIDWEIFVWKKFCVLIFIMMATTENILMVKISQFSV